VRRKKGGKGSGVLKAARSINNTNKEKEWYTNIPYSNKGQSNSNSKSKSNGNSNIRTDEQTKNTS
jgi:hypothetical protein